MSFLFRSPKKAKDYPGAGDFAGDGEAKVSGASGGAGAGEGMAEGHLVENFLSMLGPGEDLADGDAGEVEDAETPRARTDSSASLTSTSGDETPRVAGPGDAGAGGLRKRSNSWWGRRPWREEVP